MAFASIDLPTPGGPMSKTAFGYFGANFAQLFTLFKKINDFGHFFFDYHPCQGLQSNLMDGS
jgi:hypothetical protein